MSAVCWLAKHLTVGNAPELFQVCSGKKRREVDQWLAARFPRADVPDRLQKLEALSEGRFGLHFTADAEFVELLGRMRALASHRAPGADLASLIKLALRDSVQLMEKRRFGLGRKPRAVKVPERADNRSGAPALESLPPGEREQGSRLSQRSRHVPVAAARGIRGGRRRLLFRGGRRPALRSSGIPAARSHPGACAGWQLGDRKPAQPLLSPQSTRGPAQLWNPSHQARNRSITSTKTLTNDRLAPIRSGPPIPIPPLLTPSFPKPASRHSSALQPKAHGGTRPIFGD